MSDITLPTILVSAGTSGHLSVEVEGLDHPVLLARHGRLAAALGLLREALAVRFALVADGRCALCGRRLTSNRTQYSIIGRECVRPRKHRVR